LSKQRRKLTAQIARENHELALGLRLDFNPKTAARRKRSRAAMLSAPLKFPTVRKIIYPDYS